MSEVKVGDWVEVTRVDRHDGAFNIVVGDTFLVLDVLSDGGVEIKVGVGEWWLLPDQFRRSEVKTIGARYKKKPVEVEAVQFLTNNFLDVVKFTNDTAHSFVDNTCIIPTLEGEHIATVGDFIIKGVKGEFYPCKPDVFAATYERV